MEADAPLQRVPPHSEDAERGLLGSALLDADRVIDLALTKNIRPASFWYKAHQALWETLVDMHVRHAAIDLLTVNDRLRATDQIDLIGGMSYLTQLVDVTISSVHAEYYIDLVYQKSLLRDIIDQSRSAIDKCYNPDLDAQLILAETEQNLFNIADGNNDTAHDWPTLVEESIKEIYAIADRKKPVSGVMSGFRDLDRMLLGLKPSEMIILAARPSMGKTSLALNIAEHVALGKDSPSGEPTPVAVFSLEMSAESLVRRMLCCNAEMQFQEMTRGRLSQDQLKRVSEAGETLRSLPIYIDDAAGLDVLDLRARARRMHKKYNIGLMVIDYLQLCNCAQFSREGRQRETSAISGNLKAMAKELNIPVIVLSQLSRAGETRDRTGKPKLSDLRDSGSIEQDADVVFLLRRPCKYPDDKEYDDKTLAIVDVAKNRNGTTGLVRLNFDETYTRFRDRIEIYQDEPPM